MGMPKITIVFKELGITAIQRGARGIMAMILRGALPNVTAENQVTTVYTTTDIPTGISDFNKEQIELGLMGYQTTPKKILLYFLPEAETNYDKALKYLETARWDYLVIPTIKEEETMTIATWIKGLRTQKDIMVKAVLPNCPADTEGVVNFATETIVTKAKTFTTAEYCSRIAGVICGTPMTISCTFAPLPEVIDCDHLISDERNAAVDAGKLIIFHDGEKVKIARGVNSFITTIQNKGDSFKKIKLVDAMDMIHDDIKKTAQDSYLGKYANSYDNKCLLITAIMGYLDGLVLDGILDPGKNSVVIDVDQQRVYLKSKGTDVTEMKDQEVKEANTGDKVFLKGNIKILDAIEDINLPFYI